eukprot:g59171.t1
MKYYYGAPGLSPDKARAMKLVKEAARLNYAEAEHRLFESYINREVDTVVDEKMVVKRLKHAAKQQHAGAQLSLGDSYYTGKGGLEKDERKAVKLYEKAADKGHAAAQCNLGFCCAYGKGGLEKDEKKALKLYEKAADQGDAVAQWNLSARRQPPKARQLLRATCASGKGWLVKDEEEAVKLYKKAAAQGHAAAQYCLDTCYANGNCWLVKDEEAMVTCGALQDSSRPRPGSCSVEPVLLLWEWQGRAREEGEEGCEALQEGSLPIQRSRLFHDLIRTTQRPPGYVAHNISRDPGLVDCTVDPCVDKSSISTVDTNADTSELTLA